jgi:hypothetical protein
VLADCGSSAATDKQAEGIVEASQDLFRTEDAYT